MLEHHDLFDSVLKQVAAPLSHFRRVLFCGQLCFASEQLEGRTTFLLVGDGDSHEFTKKYRDAKAAGVPIVHVSCLNFPSVSPEFSLSILLILFYWDTYFRVVETLSCPIGGTSLMGVGQIHSCAITQV